MSNPIRLVRCGEKEWRALPAAGASVKVLRADKETGESTSLVRFEAGTHAVSTERGCLFLVTLPKPVEIIED